MEIYACQPLSDTVNSAPVELAHIFWVNIHMSGLGAAW